MKKIYLIVGSLAFLSYFTKAQKPDSTDFKIKKTDVDLVYNHYIQDGRHSAVTGGTGTEELTVYSPNLGINHTSGKNSYGFYGGADVISSASTDKIDFVKSSASEVDMRSHMNVSYGRQTEENYSYHLGTGFSIESDYFSIPVNAGVEFKDSLQMRTFSIEAKMFFDDLRWGRINPEHYEPVKLIYPAELRYKDWYNTYKRNSYNLILGLTQILNKRNILGVFGGITYQKGLLETPFHRVYFSNGVVTAEQLPEERYKGNITFKLNTFAGGRTIFKNSISGYTDNFGIYAFSFENVTSVKITPFITLKPNFRFHIQSASQYFAPYKKHDKEGKFHTSDYDLSAFKTYLVGLNTGFLMRERLFGTVKLNTIEMGYSYYQRTDGLHAHLLNLAISFNSEKK